MKPVGIWILLGYVAIIAVFVYAIVGFSNDARRNCMTSNETRSVLTLVLREAIAAREEAGNGEEVEVFRARYERIIADHLQPRDC